MTGEDGTENAPQIASYGSAHVTANIPAQCARVFIHFVFVWTALVCTARKICTGFEEKFLVKCRIQVPCLSPPRLDFWSTCLMTFDADVNFNPSANCK